MFEPRIEEKDVTRVSQKDVLLLKKGDMVLVRSDYQYDKYKDHYSLIVGGLIMKKRGMRPNLVTFPTNNSVLLDKFQKEDGIILLKLSEEVKNKVMEFLGIYLSTGELTSI